MKHLDEGLSRKVICKVIGTLLDAKTNLKDLPLILGQQIQELLQSLLLLVAHCVTPVAPRQSNVLLSSAVFYSG